MLEAGHSVYYVTMMVDIFHLIELEVCTLINNDRRVSLDPPCGVCILP